MALPAPARVACVDGGDLPGRAAAGHFAVASPRSVRPRSTHRGLAGVRIRRLPAACDQPGAQARPPPTAAWRRDVDGHRRARRPGAGAAESHPDRTHAGIGAMTFTEFLAIVSGLRSEEHTSELQSLMRISYAVFCLIQKNTKAH